MEEYIKIIKSIIPDSIKIELVSESSNKVFRIEKQNGEVLYAKFYQNNSSHIDNELKLYNLVDNKYLKEVVYQSDIHNMAVFKELNGKTLDELTEEEIIKYSSVIIDSVCNYIDSISKNKTSGYGFLDTNLNGKYNDFKQFLQIRQDETSSQLYKYEMLSSLDKIIFENYSSIIVPDNSIIPIDTNMKNVMVTNKEEIKFIDPGEMISGPVLMAYGDFTAHCYKTKFYDELLKKLNLNETDEKLLRIYAIFSSLNILAFLSKLGVENLDKVIPYGNRYSFYDLIYDHLDHLNISESYVKKYIGNK